MNLKDYIRSIPDYPKKGILFRDITTLIKNEKAFTKTIDLIVERSNTSGAEGARLTGGGFGGFTVSLIHKNNYDEWQKNMHKYYDNKNIFEV